MISLYRIADKRAGGDMSSGTNPAGDWAAAMQKAQADMLRQWSELGQSWARAAAPAAGAPAGAGLGGPTASAAPAAGEALARNFLQQCEQYLGVSRSLWELVTRSASIGDPEQRSRSFADGLGTLQQQFAGLWAATPFGAPTSMGMPGAAGLSAGAAFGGAFGGMPGMGGFPGMGAFTGMSGFPGAFAMPALGPTREQQESWQRLMQHAARSAQAQMQVGTQWNDIIGRALRELGERVTPRIKSGGAVGSLKEIYDLWVDSAESVYAQAARSAAFVQAQAELTNATSQLRTAQRELLEEWARQFDLPTRAELNSIHQQLRDLKAALHRT
jgi:class III poly(R)-hydroxyalkanoic acid synthase PhaE subunit